MEAQEISQIQDKTMNKSLRVAKLEKLLGRKISKQKLDGLDALIMPDQEFRYICHPSPSEYEDLEFRMLWMGSDDFIDVTDLIEGNCL